MGIQFDADELVRDIVNQTMDDKSFTFIQAQIYKPTATIANDVLVYDKLFKLDQNKGDFIKSNIDSIASLNTTATET